jgi:hypothetical protein
MASAERRRSLLRHQNTDPAATPPVAANSRTVSPLDSCSAINARHFDSVVFVIRRIVVVAENATRWCLPGAYGKGGWPKV